MAEPAKKPATKAAKKKPGQKKAKPAPVPADPEAAAIAVIAANPKLVTAAVRQNPGLIPDELVRDARLDPLIIRMQKAIRLANEIEEKAVELAGVSEQTRRIIRRTPVPSR